MRLLRKFDDYLFTLGEAGEALAFDAVAKAGVGPKLLGVVDGARIEEYIDCRYLKHEEVRDVRVMKAIARNIARCHSIDVPIRKDPNVYRDSIMSFVVDSARQVKEWGAKQDLSVFTPSIQDILKKLLAIDYLDEAQWIFDQLGKIEARCVCLSHNDVFYNNIIVKKQMNIESLKDSDIVIIDIELASNFYRGLDVGLFTFEIAFDNTNTAHPVFIGEVSEELEHEFVKEYLRMWIELNPDKYDPELDTFDNLLLESRILSLLMRIPIYLFFWKSFMQDPTKFPETLFTRSIARIPLDQKRKNQVTAMMKERNLL